VKPAGRSEASWWSRIPAILLYPLHVRGLLVVGFLGFFAWIGALTAGFGFIGWGGGTVILGLLFSTVFLVIRSSANGSEELPEIGNISNVREEVVIPGLKATALGIALYLPVIGIVVSGMVGSAETALQGVRSGGAAGSGGLDSDAVGAMLSQFSGNAALPKPSATPTPTEAERLQTEERLAAEAHVAAVAAARTFRWMAIFALLASALYPLCLIVLAISRSLLVALNPVVWAGILGRVLVPYLGLLLGVFGLGALGVAVHVPVDAASKVLPVVPGIVARMADVYLLLCTAHLLGWFVWQYRERLGYTPEEQREMDVDQVRRIKEATLAEIARGNSGLRNRSASTAPPPPDPAAPPKPRSPK
jgi:hypothetical protein